MYSPELGRWLSRDPIEEAGGPNRTAFMENSPVVFVDPLGLLRWEGSASSVGGNYYYFGVHYYDYDLWSECYRGADGCCYIQWVKVRAFVFSFGPGLGIDLTGISGGQESAIFTTPNGEGWEAFRGGIELEKALEINFSSKSAALYSSFFIGSAKYEGTAVVDFNQSSFDLSVGLTVIVKSLGYSFAELKSIYQCDCETGKAK
jgi:hypothetical protein